LHNIFVIFLLLIYNNHLTFSAQFPIKTIKKILVMNIAENKLMMIPKASVNANPLMKEVATKNKIAQTINELKLLSLIDGHALLKPSSMA